MNKGILVVVLVAFLFKSCNAQNDNSKSANNNQQSEIICGAERIYDYLHLLKNKNVALLVNQTSMVGSTHLADTLLASGVSIKKIFAPEHGFRGDADAGEHVNDSVDSKTNLRLISLYGKKVKPADEELADVDVVVFDVQDVGARFYTFISSLHYLMESCAKNKKELIVLDRPNPNGWYIDGPVLKKEFQSFVGVDEIPVVHGLTVGEHAMMVNGERWLKDSSQCRLKVITCLNYHHAKHYSLPVKPSPNLPNDVAVYLYPSLCFFEGTDISLGRGTDFPFQVFGAPQMEVGDFLFTPQSKAGAKNPPHINETCRGFDLRKANITVPDIRLSFLLSAYELYSDTSTFFLKTGFFEKLAGTDELRKQIVAKKSEVEIRTSWQKDLNTYKTKRKKYLLYKDFE